jgi:hypothetical protein
MVELLNHESKKRHTGMFPCAEDTPAPCHIAEPQGFDESENQTRSRIEDRELFIRSSFGPQFFESDWPAGRDKAASRQCRRHGSLERSENRVKRSHQNILMRPEARPLEELPISRIAECRFETRKHRPQKKLQISDPIELINLQSEICNLQSNERN